MKRLLVALLLCMATAAQACLPMAVRGDSGPVLTLSQPTGQAWGQWCKMGTNTTTNAEVWGVRTWACLSARCNPAQAVAALGRIAAASDVRAQIAVEMAAAASAPAAGSQAERDFAALHYAMCSRLYENVPAGVQAQPKVQACGEPREQRWIVGPATRSDGTRPAYPWSAGVRGATSTARATSGSACDPAVGRLEGSTAYHGVNGSAALVAVCVRAP